MSSISVSSENDIDKSTQIVINPPTSIDKPVSNGVHYPAEELPEIIVEIIESIKTEAQIAIQNNLNIFSEKINLDLLRYDIFISLFILRIFNLCFIWLRNYLNQINPTYY